MLEQFLTPEMIASVTGLLVGVGTMLGVSGRSNRKAAAKTKDEPSAHQPIVRPETPSDMRVADATERLASAVATIAGSADKIERHLEWLARGGER